MSKTLLCAMSAVAVVFGGAACGHASAPTATTSSAVSSVPSTSTTAQAGPPSPCTDLGGTFGADQLCTVHDETAAYTIDFSFPVDYPEPQTITDYLKHERVQFEDFAKQFPPTGRPAPYSLNITGTTYRSGSPTAGTQSLVFEVDDDEGLAHEGHPDTAYDVFNYDLGKRAPITLDTLFTPGTRPAELLGPIVGPKLAQRFGDDVLPFLQEAGPTAYESFAITDDVVIFYFGESALRVSNSGPFQVSVPRSQLGPALALAPVAPAPHRAR